MEDPTFGELAWNGDRYGVWHTRRDAPFLRGFGGDGTAPTIELVVRGSQDSPIEAAQREAFESLDGDAVAERLRDYLVDLYRRQRPIRVRWWPVQHPDKDLAALPDVNDPAEAAKLYEPVEICVNRPSPGDPRPPAINVIFKQSFDGQRLGVILRDGHPVHHRGGRGSREPDKFDDMIDHPVVGRIKQERSGGWTGTYRTRLLNGDHLASKWLAFKLEHPEIPMQESPEWKVLNGDYSMLIDAPSHGSSTCSEPSPKQVEAYQQFMVDQEKHERQVLNSLADYLRENRHYYAEEGNAAAAVQFPEIRSHDDVLSWVTLDGVSVAWPGDDGEAGLAFYFSWDNEHPLGCAWRKGRVVFMADDESAAFAAGGSDMGYGMIDPA